MCVCVIGNIQIKSSSLHDIRVIFFCCPPQYKMYMLSLLVNISMDYDLQCIKSEEKRLSASKIDRYSVQR